MRSSQPRAGSRCTKSRKSNQIRRRLSDRLCPETSNLGGCDDLVGAKHYVRVFFLFFFSQFKPM